MTSTSPSLSEGEVSEAALPNSRKDMNVDRHYRPYQSSRSRSRSPYRGVKRRIDEYTSYDRREKKSSKVRFEDGSSNSYKRYRQRSRSPYRHKQKPEQEHRTVVKEAISSISILKPEIINIESVDESKEIEERKKRRDALKAKFKDRQTPLLAQVLNATTANSAPTTPLLQDQNSPLLISPQSPASLHQDDVASPSAIDYDPTQDMVDDRIKHDSRFQQEFSNQRLNDKTEMSKGSINILQEDENNNNDNQNNDNNDDDDDDNDDDMFAPTPVDKLVIKEVSKSNPTDVHVNLLDNWDDHEGYYRIILGEVLDGRYRVQANLGKGMFSGVVRALDQNTDKLVAIKIIRSQEAMKKAGLKEIDILQKLSEADPLDKRHVIRLERFFDYKGHLCMVFENLDINLREVLKKYGRDVGISLKAVKVFAQQMFMALSLFQKCNIIHADIKPDNILVNDAHTKVKVCDLGSAGDASENDITPYLVSRFYRAPEIILGLQYDFGIDMWSVGCTLYELFTGKILFMGRNNNQMLKSMMECRGKFGFKLLKKAEFAGLHFDDNLLFRSQEKDKITNKDVIRMININRPTKDLKTRLMKGSKDLNESEKQQLSQFIDLLDRCLNLNPEKRITPSEALKHAFIITSKPPMK